MVSQIRFKNFKIFRQWQTLELRPITILIGKNNSGKSAVARLPVMIAGSLSGKYSVPLPLSHEGVKIASSNEELFYNKNHSERIELIIEAINSTKIEVAVSGGTPHKPNISLRKYLFNDKDIDIEKSKFKGFTTQAIDTSTFLFKLDYIDSIRSVLPPQNSTEEDFDRIGINGENTYKILPQYFVSNDNIFSEIKEWFETNFQGWAINIREILSSSSLFEVVLSNYSIKNIGIENTGSGIKQSLPLIVRSFMPVSEPTLIIIEEPETHLHPAAHGVLAQRFAESYLEDNNRRYLIETHSQNFVLRMRRLVAEGKLKPENLAIYYVEFDEEKNESNLRFIKVDKGGGVDWWPQGVFGETNIEK
ncbi:MAG: AAA family ATPase, partial [Thermoflexibacter sp.]|nr:AAA family ATPase [Thermoflexibacter sp.]